jgi:hypothetical protein
MRRQMDFHVLNDNGAEAPSFYIYQVLRSPTQYGLTPRVMMS